MKQVCLYYRSNLPDHSVLVMLCTGHSFPFRYQGSREGIHWHLEIIASSDVWQNNIMPIFAKNTNQSGWSEALQGDVMDHEQTVAFLRAPNVNEEVAKGNLEEVFGRSAHQEYAH